MKMTWSERQRFEGASQFLLLLLVEKFGPLPEKVRHQIEAINSPNRLNKLAVRVLTAHSLEEMGLAEKAWTRFAQLVPVEYAKDQTAGNHEPKLGCAVLDCFGHHQLRVAKAANALKHSYMR